MCVEQHHGCRPTVWFSFNSVFDDPPPAAGIHEVSDMDWPAYYKSVLSTGTYPQASLPESRLPPIARRGAFPFGGWPSHADEEEVSPVCL